MTETSPLASEADAMRRHAREIAASLPPLTDAEIRQVAALARELDARRRGSPAARSIVDGHTAGIEAGWLATPHDQLPAAQRVQDDRAPLAGVGRRVPVLPLPDRALRHRPGLLVAERAELLAQLR